MCFPINIVPWKNGVMENWFVYSLDLYLLFSPWLQVNKNVEKNDLSLCSSLEQIEKRQNQNADSTAWTEFLMVFNYYSWYCVNANQLPSPTFYYMHECQDSLIQCSTVQGFLYQFLEFTPLRYEQQKRFNIHQHFDIFRVLGDQMRLRLITERYRELVPHICSFHMIK